MQNQRNRKTNNPFHEVHLQNIHIQNTTAFSIYGQILLEEKKHPHWSHCILQCVGVLHRREQTLAWILGSLLIRGRSRNSFIARAFHALLPLPYQLPEIYLCYWRSLFKYSRMWKTVENRHALLAPYTHSPSVAVGANHSGWGFPSALRCQEGAVLL